MAEVLQKEGEHPYRGGQGKLHVGDGGEMEMQRVWTEELTWGRGTLDPSSFLLSVLY